MSQATITAVQRLSRTKQLRLETMAHKYLVPHEYSIFKDKFDSYFDKPVKIHHHKTLKPPFENSVPVQRSGIEAFRKAL